MHPTRSRLLCGAALLAGLALTAACDMQRREAAATNARGPAAVPAGTTASGQNAAVPGSVGNGPAGINQPYYIGADPNNPRPAGGGSRGN